MLMTSENSKPVAASGFKTSPQINLKLSNLCRTFLNRFVRRIELVFLRVRFLRKYATIVKVYLNKTTQK
jgi:hypothetical protein